LLPPGTPPEPNSQPLPRPDTERAAVEAARDLARDRVRRRSFAIAFAGIVRGRALEGVPLPTGGGELDLRGWFGRAGIVFRVGIDAGSAHRAQGNVRALAVIAGLGAAGRWSVARRWDLGIVAIVGAGIGRLRGVPAPGVHTGSITAATGQLTIGAGPRVRLGRIALELDAELGGMLRSPRGLVSGDRAVTLGGLFAGAALRLVIETPIAR
jgi:hypothetical protein